jgi:hypothetical protein
MGQPMSERLHRLVQAGFCLYEMAYRRVRRLEAVGPMLFVGQTSYRGPSRILFDQTRLEPGDLLGTLHLNNACITELHRLEAGAAFAFTRLLRASLGMLAQRAENDPAWRKVAVFRGITWFPPLGQQVGFVVEPLPDGLKARFLEWHFRLLLYVFHPRNSSKGERRIQTHVFWLTRRQLLQHFAMGESGPDEHL